MGQKDAHSKNHHVLCRYRRHIQQRNSVRRKNERVVFKCGEFNLAKPTSNTKFRVVPNIFSKFVEAKWKWSLLFCIAIYIFIWLTFAVIWWLIMYLHGDFEIYNLSQSNHTDWKPCVREIYSFTSIFLFSVEIHTTIGYGKRAITLECPAAIFTMCIESIAGHITQAIIVGIVFAKLTRPKNRANTLLFSKNAIINQRDGYLCLLFRVGNMRKSRIIAAHIKAFLIKYERKTDNNTINPEQIELNVKVDGSDDILFISSVTAVHKIDGSSPLYNISARNMLELDLEILVAFEGIIECTGQPVQAISSYTTQEILWGRRFSQSTFYQKGKEGFVKDFVKFDETYGVNTPLCKASDLDNYYRKRTTLLIQKYLLNLRDIISLSHSSRIQSKLK